MSVRFIVRIVLLTVTVVLAVGALSGGPESVRAQSGTPFNPKVDEYTVQQGDTMWGITEKVVGSAWLWPKVWSYNPEIANPNWIYPGDVIYFYQRDFTFPSLLEQPVNLAGRAMEFEQDEVGSVEAEASDPVEVVQTLPRNRGRVGGKRLYNMFITSDELQESGVLVNAADDDMLLSNRDVVFLEFPDDQVPKRGDDFMIYRTVEKVEHPDGGSFGYITEVTGFAKVSFGREDGVVTAEIYQAEREIDRGNYVTPKVDLREPIKPKKAVARLEGVVVAVHSGWGVIGSEQQFAFIDLGSDAGLERGNDLLVFRRSDPKRDRGRGNDLPLRPIARLRVVDAKQEAATVLVLDSIEEIEIGNLVRTITQ